MGQFESITAGFDELDRLNSLNMDLSIHGVCEKIKSKSIQKIVILCGAGISVSAGIPDFRSPQTGIYNNLQEYNLSEPEDMFDIKYFRKNPFPFYSFIQKMYGTNFKPTLCHYFMRLLEKKGLLTRIYTQNIDDLESKVKISNKLLIQCHGTISKLSCTKCHKQFESVIMKNIINKENIDEYEDKTIINRILERNEIETKEDEDITSLFISHDNSVVYYRNIPYCYGADMCLGIIKPNIVFYGEQLPKRYFWLLPSDMMVCDLLIIMGTSLQVYPCCEIINKINELAIRMLWNNNVIGPFTQNIKTNYRDVVCIDNIDDIVEKFCKEMRWTKELYRIKQKFEETSGYFSEFIRYFSPKEKEEKGK